MPVPFPEPVQYDPVGFGHPTAVEPEIEDVTEKVEPVSSPDTFEERKEVFPLFPFKIVCSVI
jgi:hypothetical protein